MSYRSDMEYMKTLYEERKAAVTRLLKLSFLLLAALILITLVAIIITAAVGGFSSGDDDAPAVRGPEGGYAVISLGETISYKSLVEVSDEDESVELTVDNSAVDPTKEGTYPVYYTATDSSGNETQYTLQLVIKKQAYSRAALMKLVEARAQALGMKKDMDRALLVRKIYEFVRDPNASATEANIRFTDESNTPSQKLSRESWEVDWIEEACRTLSMERMSGDCYTYYAVSKAFFEYFGIENLGIQRSSAAQAKGTHFWNVVNVGTKSAPRWYFYDATRLAGSFTADGTNHSCLITEKKLLSYVGSNGEKDFYLFEKGNAFPKIATEALSE